MDSIYFFCVELEFVLVQTTTILMEEINQPLIKFWKIKSFRKIFFIGSCIIIVAVLVFGILKSDAYLFLAKEKKQQITRIDAIVNAPNFSTSEQNKSGIDDLSSYPMHILEKKLALDLCAFSVIEKAHIALNALISSENNDPIKASVILTLKSEKFLDPIVQQSICFYLAGAVQGLQPDAVTIADSRGRLYQFIPLQIGKLVLEQEVKEKVDSFLLKILEPQDFISMISVITPVESSEIDEDEPRDRIKINLIVNQPTQQEEILSKKNEVERCLSLILEDYRMPFLLNIEWAHFSKPAPALNPHIAKKPFFSQKVLLGIFFVFFGILSAGILFLRAFKKNETNLEKTLQAFSHTNTDEQLFHTMTTIDLNYLVDSFRDEDPETIALMLSYLSPERMKCILEKLKSPLKEEVMRLMSDGYE